MSAIIMTEEYCSFEVAKLLKEKGFNEPCWNYYVKSHIDHYFRPVRNNEWTSDKVSIPTLQMAMKWLREEKHIFIRIIQSNIEYCACEIYFDRVRCHQFRESFTSYEEAVEAALKYCLTNLI